MISNVSVSHITLFSADQDKTALFYKAIGFNLEKSSSWTGYHYLGIFESSGKKLFFKIYPKVSESSASTGLGFEVDNVAETLNKLIALSTPVLRPGNSRIYNYATIAEVMDPDGRIIGLYQRDR